MVGRIVIAAAFSLFYVAMYPILIGGFVIYVYPYWPPGVALAWVVCGILVQAWFCVGPGKIRSTELTQMGAGILYAASVMLLAGGCYQS